MEQEEIKKHLTLLLSQGYLISKVDWSTGEIMMKIPKFPPDALSKTELAACKVSKIAGIKEVRSNRGFSLAEAKAFVEKHFQFPESEAWQTINKILIDNMAKE